MVGKSAFLSFSAPGLAELDMAVSSRLPSSPRMGARSAAASPFRHGSASSSAASSPASSVHVPRPRRQRRSSLSCQAMLIGPEAAALAPPPGFSRPQMLPTVMSGRIMSSRFMNIATDLALSSNITATQCFTLYDVPQHTAPALVSHPEELPSMPSGSMASAIAAGAGTIGIVNDLVTVKDATGLASCMATPMDPNGQSATARTNAFAAASGRSVIHLQSANEIMQSVDRYGDWIRRNRRMKRAHKLNTLLQALGGTAAVGKSVDDAFIDNDVTDARMRQEDVRAQAVRDDMFLLSQSQAGFIHCPI